MSDISGLPVTELDLSVLSRKRLRQLEISTVGELASRTETELSAANIGPGCLQEMKLQLMKHGLALCPSNEIALPTNEDRSVLEIISSHTKSGHPPAVAEWLAAKILSDLEGRELQAAKVLWRDLFHSTKNGGAIAPNRSILLRLACSFSGEIAGANPDANAIAHWLALQILKSTNRQVLSSAKLLLVVLLTDNGRNDCRQAAENALVWMVLHTRSSANLSRRQCQTLLSVSEVQRDRLDWAVMILDKKVIRPHLKQGRWWERCRYAERRRGFDFADEGVNFVWERIEKYADSGSTFRKWIDAVLGNFWNSLHRKWKREVTVGSMSAKELESLGDDYVRPRNTDAVNGQTSLKYRSLVHAPPNAPLPEEMLSASDVEILSDWESIDGLMMGYETDLWHRIPANLWKRWLTDVVPWDREREIRATPPPKRRALLAEIIGKEKNTLAKRWQRLKPKLAQLNCVATILDRAGTSK